MKFIKSWLYVTTSVLTLITIISCGDNSDPLYCNGVRDFHKDELLFCEQHNFEGDSLFLTSFQYTDNLDSEILYQNTLGPNLHGILYFLEESRFKLRIRAQFSEIFDSLLIDQYYEGNFGFTTDSIKYRVPEGDSGLSKYSTLSLVSDDSEFNQTEIWHRMGCATTNGIGHSIRFEDNGVEWRLGFFQEF